VNPDDAVDLSIRNQRPNRVTVPLLISGLLCMWVTVCGLRVSGLLDQIFPPEVELYALGIISCGILALAFSYQPIRHWKLGEALVVWPRGRYQPRGIREIAFAPDPAEDFDDAATPARLCQVRAHLRSRRELRLIASVWDARRVRDWAVRRGIAVSDPSAVLEAVRHDP
jgi:hypothetical protein